MLLNIFRPIPHKKMLKDKDLTHEHWGFEKTLELAGKDIDGGFLLESYHTIICDHDSFDDDCSSAELQNSIETYQEIVSALSFGEAGKWHMEEDLGKELDLKDEQRLERLNAAMLEAKQVVLGLLKVKVD